MIKTEVRIQESSADNLLFVYCSRLLKAIRLWLKIASVQDRGRSYVFASDLGEEIFSGSSDESHRLLQLVDVVLTGEQWFARQKFSHDATHRPNIDYTQTEYMF